MRLPLLLGRRPALDVVQSRRIGAAAGAEDPGVAAVEDVERDLGPARVEGAEDVAVRVAICAAIRFVMDVAIDNVVSGIAEGS